MAEYIHPSISSTITDNSVTYVTASGTTKLFAVFTSEKGPDNEIKMITSVSEFEFFYGEPNMKLYGQTAYNIVNWLQSGGVVYCLRVLPDDAGYSNAIVNIQTKVGTKKVKDINGNLVEVNDVTIRPVISYTQYSNSTKSTIEIDALRSSKNTANNPKTIDGYKNNMIFAVIPKGRGEGYNDIGFRIYLNSSYDSTYDFRLYNIEITKTTSSGGISTIEGPFIVSLDPDALSISGESMFIVNVIKKYSNYVEVIFNEENYNTLAEIINPNVHPNKIDFFTGITRLIDDTPETYTDPVTGNEEDIHMSIITYDSNNEPTISRNIIDTTDDIESQLVLSDNSVRLDEYNRYLIAYENLRATYFEIQNKTARISDASDVTERSPIISKILSNKINPYVTKFTITEPNVSPSTLDADVIDADKTKDFYKLLSTYRKTYYYGKTTTETTSYPCYYDYTISESSEAGVYEVTYKEVYYTESELAEKHTGDIVSFETFKAGVTVADGTAGLVLAIDTEGNAITKDVTTEVEVPTEGQENHVLRGDEVTNSVYKALIADSSINSNFLANGTSYSSEDSTSYLVYPAIKGLEYIATEPSSEIVSGKYTEYDENTDSLKTTVKEIKDGNGDIVATETVYSTVEKVINVDDSVTVLKYSDSDITSLNTNVKNSILSIKNYFDNILDDVSNILDYTNFKPDTEYTEKSSIISECKDKLREMTNLNIKYVQYINDINDLRNEMEEVKDLTTTEKINFISNVISVISAINTRLDADNQKYYYEGRSDGLEFNLADVKKTELDALLDSSITRSVTYYYNQLTSEYASSNLVTDYINDLLVEETLNNVYEVSEVVRKDSDGNVVYVVKSDGSYARSSTGSRIPYYDQVLTQYTDTAVITRLLDAAEMTVRLILTESLYNDMNATVKTLGIETPISTYDYKNMSDSIINSIISIFELDSSNISTFGGEVAKISNSDIESNITLYSSTVDTKKQLVYKSQIQNYDSNVSLLYGSDGSITGELPSSTAVERLVAKGYLGTIDDTLLDKDIFPVDVVLDANYGTGVKNALITLVRDMRPDFVAMLDTKLQASPSATLEYRKGNLSVSDYHVSIWGQDFVVSDTTYTGQKIQVTPTYFLASKIPSNDNANGIHWNFVGPRRGTLSGFEQISYLPNPEWKEQLYKAQINYTEQDTKSTRFGCQLTSQSVVSALSNINNVRTLLRIQREVELMMADYQFEYNDSTTRGEAQIALNGYLSQWTSNRACDSISGLVYASDYDRLQKIMRVKIEMVFNSLIERISIDLIVNN